MRIRTTRTTALVSPALVSLALAAAAVGSVAPAGATEDAAPRPYDDNVVVALNQSDGAKVTDSEVRVRFDGDGTVDQQNRAIAQANCTNCTTMAVAMQIVVVTSPPSVLLPLNQAQALNVQCQSCTTYASASQIVVGTDGPARLTGRGVARVALLRLRLRNIEFHAGSMLRSELVKAVDAAEQELIAIADEEIVPVHLPEGARPPALRMWPLQRDRSAPISA